MPDVELLQFQKQRSTPKVSLSSVNVDGIGEDIICEVDDFGTVNENANQIGMAPAGLEEQVVRELQRAGSLGGREAQVDANDALQEDVDEEQKID